MSMYGQPADDHYPPQPANYGSEAYASGQYESGQYGPGQYSPQLPGYLPVEAGQVAYPTTGAPLPGQPTGQVAWLAALAGYIPIPLVNYVVWLIVAIVQFRTSRHQHPVAAANARNALNWCITYGAAFVVLTALLFIEMAVAPGRYGDGWLGHDRPPLFLIVLFGWLLIGGIFALINMIAGAIRAGSGRVHSGLIAIPFVRAR